VGYELNGAKRYENTILPFVRKTYTDDDEYRQEVAAVVDGMRMCNHSLAVPELGRDFTPDDLLYLNTCAILTPNKYTVYPHSFDIASSYGTYAEWSAHGSSTGNVLRRRRKACTQVSAWGGASADGATIAGRNMDGENDFRKSTVLHLVLFAVEPQAPDMRYVGVFWRQ
jgi:hypothetical protein